MSVQEVLTIDSVLLCMSKEQTIAGRVLALFYCCPALHFTTFCIIIILFDVLIPLSYCKSLVMNSISLYIGDNPVLGISLEELMDEVNRIEGLEDPVASFLSSDEFRSVDPSVEEEVYYDT